MPKQSDLSWTRIVFFVFIHIAAIVGLLQTTPNVYALSLFALFFIGSGGLAFQIGLHRYFAHRSFKTIKPVEYLFSWLVSINFQGGVARWVANHKIHHQKADRKGDLHSPLRGFFWAHFWWLVDQNNSVLSAKEIRQYASNVVDDPVHGWIENMAIPSTLCLAYIFYVVAGPAGLAWGIFIRLVAVYHVTWFVNSAAHLWGYRNFETPDNSRNLWWTAIFTFGEWHNNHHRFPSSARAGFRWYEVDIGWRIIQIMQLLGLAWDVRLPNMPELYKEMQGQLCD